MVSVLGWPEMLAFVSMVTTVGKNLHKNKQRWMAMKKKRRRETPNGKQKQTAS